MGTGHELAARQRASHSKVERIVIHGHYTPGNETTASPVQDLWSSLDLVETSTALPTDLFEGVRTYSAQMTVTPCAIIEGLYGFRDILYRCFSIFVNMPFDPLLF